MTHAAATDAETPAPPTPAARLRRAAPLIVLAVVLIVLAVVSTRTPASGLPLDPRSSDADGTRALTLVLERLGAQVSILDEFPIVADYDVVLVLVDNVGATMADRLRDHASAGGVLVVTDPGGDLSPETLVRGPAHPGLLDARLQRNCDVPAFRDAASVRVGSSAVLEVPDGADGCYRRGEDAWLVAQTLGSGTVVTTGGPGFVTNALLGEADNAVLAAALLAPEPGTRVAILSPTFAVAGDAGDPSLSQLIPLSLRLAAVQLLIAFVVFALWRARRLGRPVREPQEVRLPGSELVVAVGSLLHRTGARSRAAELLRDEVRHSLAQRLGLPADADAQQLAETAAARAGVPVEETLWVLAGPPPADDTQLVALAHRAEALRNAVMVPVASGAVRADIE